MSQSGTPAPAPVSIWQSFVNAAKAAWSTITTDVESVVTAIAPTVEADVSAAVSQLLPIAMQLVLGFAGAQFGQWSGGQKAAAVDAALVATAKTQAISVGVNTIATIRQQAFNALGATAPSTTG